MIEVYNSPFSPSYPHCDSDFQHHTLYLIPQILIPRFQIPKAKNSQNLINILCTYNKKGIITSSDSFLSSIGLGSVSTAENSSLKVTVRIYEYPKDEKADYKNYKNENMIEKIKLPYLLVYMADQVHSIT